MRKDALANRKKGFKIGVAILCVAAIFGFFMGFFGSSIFEFFSSKNASPKEFSGNGMTLTLTDAFVSETNERFTNSYFSDDVAVMALKEEFSLLEGFENYTLEEYANLVIENNGIVSSKVEHADGITYFEYDSYSDKDTYKYLAFVYKTKDAFWLVQFATNVEDAKEYEPKIMEWAKTVTFE